VAILLVAVGGCSEKKDLQALPDGPARIEKESLAHYPRIARLARSEGQVTARVQIREDHSVGEVEVVEASHRMLGQFAERVVRRHRYRAAVQDGKPVDSSIEVVTRFACPRDLEGNLDVDLPISDESRSQIVDVPDGRLCVYGYWISGDSEFRLDGSRFYVEGFRLYPPMYPLDLQEAVAGGYIDEHRQAMLRRECKILWRDLERQGKSPHEIAEGVSQLVVCFPGVLSYEVRSNGEVIASCESGFDVRFNAVVPSLDGDGDDAHLFDGSAIAEDMYYNLLFRVGRDCIYIQGRGSFNVCRSSDRYETVLAEIGLARSANEPISGDNWDGSRTLLPSHAEMIRKPWWVYRD